MLARHAGDRQLAASAGLSWAHAGSRHVLLPGKVMIMCVLRSGGEYKPCHVQWLARQVPGLVAITDVKVPGVRCIPMLHEWPGWWAKTNRLPPCLSWGRRCLSLPTVGDGGLGGLWQLQNLHT